jgi:putative mRNA 3-end processing factor
MKRVFFKGGAKEVGRSAVLVDTGNENILMDYGLKLEEKPIGFPKPINEKLSGILISHGHLDHLGAIPRLFNKGQNCPVYGMEITSRFTKLLLNDSLKIAKQDGYNLGYGDKDIRDALKHFRPIRYRKPFNIGKTRVTAFDAGHISGSCMFLLDNSKRVLYTGDLRLGDTRLIKGADIDIENTDVLITETTYSDREHPDRDKEERRFVEFIKETLNNDGVAVVSAFAISRTQEMLLILDEYELGVPIYIDGMCSNATDIIDAYPELQREYNILKKALQRTNVKFMDRPSRRKKIIKQPCIVITGSGMLSGGPVVEYIKKLYNREECSLSLTGFQIPGTEGSILLQTGKFVHDDLNLDVKMKVGKFDFSSHASRSELFKLVKRVNPEKIFCIHGDKTEKFAQELREEYGFDAISPSSDRWYLF